MALDSEIMVKVRGAARWVMTVRRDWWTGPGRYLLLSVVVVALLLQHAWTDAWQGDFWIYVATVGELKADLWHPSHPLCVFASPDYELQRVDR